MYVHILCKMFKQEKLTPQIKKILTTLEIEFQMQNLKALTWKFRQMKKPVQLLPLQQVLLGHAYRSAQATTVYGLAY